MTEELNEGQAIPEDLLHQNLMDLFKELSFRERVTKVVHGLKQPKSTGEYKWAKLQMWRLSAPISSVVVPLLLMGFLMIFGVMGTQSDRAVEVQIMEPEAAPELDKVVEIEREKVDVPQPDDVPFTPDVNVADNPMPGPAQPFSPVPATFDAVAIVRSPVIMKGIYGARTGAARGVALREYGGGGATEDAVMRALRWLKKNQAASGSWGGSATAFTGFALLAYLAHGETPSSEEFGETVEKAIRFLVQTQKDDGTWPSISYQHQIATYALCEAYTMTKVPMIKYAAEKGVYVIVQGQNPAGGWNYGLKACDRNDMSVGAWCAQALKAAKMAGIEVEGLDKAYKHAVNGAIHNAAPTGGFGYTGPGATGLTGAGILWMQLLGAGNKPEAKRGLQFIENKAYDWDKLNPPAWNAIYYWYYDTQAKFHAGGETWTRWNKLFAPALVNAQEIEKAAIAGPGGKMYDIGHWVAKGGHGPVMDTCLCTLQLEVYYRYLPTYKQPEVEAEPDVAAGKEEVEVKIN